MEGRISGPTLLRCSTNVQNYHMISYYIILYYIILLFALCLLDSNRNSYSSGGHRLSCKTRDLQLLDPHSLCLTINW